MRLIKNAVFVKSLDNFVGFKGFELPEVVIVGRSNVGKSSLINMLANNSKLAKVSATQGKTKLANFFRFNNDFLLVDLPGYGYAQTSRVEQQKWANFINSYLELSKNIKSAILLVDIRHKPTEQDIEMFEYFIVRNIPVTIVATKYDKIKKSERPQKISQIANTFNVGFQNIYVCSSETSHGKDEIVDRIYQFIGGGK